MINDPDVRNSQSRWSVYGFHWRMRDAWISTDPAFEAAPVAQTMLSIWNQYLAPLATNAIRFHINIYASQQVTGCDPSITRLISLCRFAQAQNIRLIPIFAGSGKFSSGKEREFGPKVEHFVGGFLDRLVQAGLSHLYARIAAWQIEDEMNHFIRHAGWAENVYTEMLIDAAQRVRRAERQQGAVQCADRMVIFPADMMFFKAFLKRPWQYVPAMLRQQRFDYTVPGDLTAFVACPDIEIIGVDMYPGLYAPLATVDTFLWLVRRLCAEYGAATRYGKKILVAEAGCPTWPSSRRREERQLRFFQDLLCSLTSFDRTGGRESGFLGLLWYCFNDQHIKFMLWPPQEWRFGVVKTVPGNEWFATNPSDPKLVWYWLRDIAEHGSGRGAP